MNLAASHQTMDELSVCLRATLSADKQERKKGEKFSCYSFSSNKPNQLKGLFCLIVSPGTILLESFSIIMLLLHA